MQLTIRKIVTYKETILVEEVATRLNRWTSLRRRRSSETHGPDMALLRICHPRSRPLAPFLASA